MIMIDIEEQDLNAWMDLDKVDNDYYLSTVDANSIHK